jgi:3-dehydroquinate synthase
MKTIEQRFTVTYEYPVVFCQGLFGVDNHLLVDLLSRDEMAPAPYRIVIVIDRGVERCHPHLTHQITEWLTAHKDVVELATPIEFLPGNEFVKKHDGVVERLVKLAYQTHIGRKDTFVVIGGGAVQDVVGYAASVVHRGCRIIRVNTTTLSQGDAGVGVKNGVDYGSAKNFLGTFAPPLAVVNDTTFLSTLTDRDWRNGIAEAVKVAVIKDIAFFEWLQANAAALRERDERAMNEMIYRSAQLHLAHISGAGDPFERGSARPLDFGHWCAHRLEAMSCYQMSHGEAVAIGIALDMIYASLLDLVTPVEATHVIALLKNCGLRVWCDELVLRGTDDRLAILEGIRQFREHLGGNLCITLPDGLGRKTEIHEMNEALLERAVTLLRERHA